MLVWRRRLRMRLCAAFGRSRGWCDLRAAFAWTVSRPLTSAKKNERKPFMESINAARRTEDIALDLLKFVAAHANVGSKAVSATGFGVSAAAKPEEQVA